MNQNINKKKKKREEAGMYLDKPNPKAFIEYSNTMEDVYNNIEN